MLQGLGARFVAGILDAGDFIFRPYGTTWERRLDLPTSDSPLAGIKSATVTFATLDSDLKFVCLAVNYFNLLVPVRRRRYAKLDSASVATPSPLLLQTSHPLLRDPSPLLTHGSHDEEKEADRRRLISDVDRRIREKTETLSSVLSLSTASGSNVYVLTLGGVTESVHNRFNTQDVASRADGEWAKVKGGHAIDIAT